MPNLSCYVEIHKKLLYCKSNMETIVHIFIITYSITSEG